VLGRGRVIVVAVVDVVVVEVVVNDVDDDVVERAATLCGVLLHAASKTATAPTASRCGPFLLRNAAVVRLAPQEGPKSLATPACRAPRAGVSGMAA